MIDNKPYVFEILITETEKQAYYFGVNHSVTFGDYLREASIKAVDKGKAKIWGRGIKGALDKILEGQHTVVAHLIEIGLPFLDHGKSNLSLPYHMVENISGAVWKAVKVLHKNQLQRQKNAERYYRYNESINKELKDVKVTLKAAVFTVMEAAIKAATDNKSGPASVRQVFYQVRPLIQPHTTEILTWTYFQKLIHRYWREYEHNPLVYNDPRGGLYTPHSGREVHLGTFSVESFEFPDYEYNKILYIEKKGLWPAIKDANLHKRYDMVVIAGEGYATEAIRVLLEKAQVGKNYAIFVLHDADHAGYNIARTLQSATERMPNHNIRVHDLGLTVQDSIDMGLEPETYPRQIDLPKGLLLNAIEQEYFEGEWQETSWLCKRVELNAMNRGQLIAYIKNGIDRISEEFGLEKKVIAPGQVLLEKAQEKIKSALEEKFEELLSEQLKLDNAKAELFEAFSDEFDEEELTDDVVDYLIENQFKTWGDSIQDVVDEKMDDIDADVENKIIELVMVAIKAA
jgi:hypothetical protein